MENRKQIIGTGCQSSSGLGKILSNIAKYCHARCTDKYIKISLDQNYTRVWQVPLLAQPGPDKDAIHCALLSLLISSTCLMATSLLPAASLAAGVIRPTLAKRHKACALTAVVDNSRRYCPTTVPRSRSVSCRPVASTMCATLASAQL